MWSTCLPTAASSALAGRTSRSSLKRKVTGGLKRPSGADMAHSVDSYVAERERVKQIRPRVPAALDRIRQTAFDHFLAHGFPTTHEEEWRFTSVAPIAEHAF